MSLKLTDSPSWDDALHPIEVILRSAFDMSEGGPSQRPGRIMGVNSVERKRTYVQSRTQLSNSQARERLNDGAFISHASHCERRRTQAWM